MRSIKLPKGMKVTKDKSGKTVIETDWEKKRRQKPAGQQYFDTKKVKVKK